MKAAAVNPLDLLILTASIKLIENYSMPVTLGYDAAARKQGKEYRFLFVHSDGAQLQKITKIVERNHIIPAIDSHVFSLSQANDALRLVAKGAVNGKVIIKL